MGTLFDEVLETLLHSAIWRSTWHLELTTLIIVAVVAFLILVYRRSRRGSKGRSRRRSGYRYRKRYPK